MHLHADFSTFCSNNMKWLYSSPMLLPSLSISSTYMPLGTKCTFMFYVRTNTVQILHWKAWHLICIIVILENVIIVFELHEYTQVTSWVVWVLYISTTVASWVLHTYILTCCKCILTKNIPLIQIHDESAFNANTDQSRAILSIRLHCHTCVVVDDITKEMPPQTILKVKKEKVLSKLQETFYSRVQYL